MATNIGLNVIEVDGAGAPAIVGAAVSVGAFNILTRRGVPNSPARIASFPTFVEQFGGFFPAGLGPYLVKGFFDNGGQTAYVNRVVAAGDTPASITLDDRAQPAARDTLTLRAGFRGREDPGAWGNDLFVEVVDATTATSRVRETAPAQVDGSALNAATDMTALLTLSVRVDGEAQATEITFLASDFANPAQATRTEIRDAINGRTTKLVASITPDNRLRLTSTAQIATLNRDWTSLQVTANNAALGLNQAANPTRGTPAPRTQTGTRLRDVEDFQVGDAIRISDGPNNAFAKVRRIALTTGEIEWDPAVANINTFDAHAIRVTGLGFDLRLALGGPNEENVVETWIGLSKERDVPNSALRRLNDPLRGSRHVVAVDVPSASNVGERVPLALAFTRFTPGSEGAPTAGEFIGDAVRTGFSAFNAYDVQLVCCERTDPAIVAAALAYCANRGDCMFVGSVPEGFTAAGQSVTYGQAFQGKKVYGALYAPWIKVFDPQGTGDNPVRWIPPTGHVMGAYARIETNRGVFKAPAGDEANLAGALDVEYRLSDAEHTDLVKNGSVNGIRPVAGAGIVVDASRTLSTDTRWLYVNVRLLFNYVKSSLRQGLRWVRQEPNRDTLWDAVKYNAVTPFLLGLWRQGAFGTGTPEQVFTIICDASNNPPDQVDQGIFKVEVYFYPSKPAETILIIVGQQPSGATAAEA